MRVPAVPPTSKHGDVLHNKRGVVALAPAGPSIVRCASSRILGRVSTGTGPAEELTAAQAKTVLAMTAADVGAPPTSRLISAGTGLTGGGNLTTDRTLTVAYGATASTACIGNDARLSDARTPTAHAISLVSAAATARVFGRITAAAGPGEELTGANVRTVCGLATTDTPAFQAMLLTAAGTGYGTPINGALQVSFDANTITLINLASAVARLINDLKAAGIVKT